MKMVRMAGTAVIIALSAAPRAHAFDRTIGDWAVSDAPGDRLPSRCQMEQGSASKGRLIGTIDPNGMFQLGFASDRLQAAEAGSVQPELSVDGVPATLYSVSEIAPDTVIFNGYGFAESEDSIGPLLETGHLARVRGRGVDVNFELVDVNAALAALRTCHTAAIEAASKTSDAGPDYALDAPEEEEDTGAGATEDPTRERRFGAWTMGVKGRTERKVCYLSQPSDTAATLIGFRKAEGPIIFAISGPANSFRPEQVAKSQISVDGRDVRAIRAEFIDGTGVALIDLAEVRTADQKHRLIEVGNTLTVTIDPFTATFDIRQGAAAIKALVRCDEALRAKAAAKQAGMEAAARALPTSRRSAGSSAGRVRWRLRRSSSAPSPAPSSSASCCPASPIRASSTPSASARTARASSTAGASNPPMWSVPAGRWSGRPSPSTPSSTP